MIIIQIFVPLLFIVLIKGAEVGRFYAFNHPPFDVNDNIPVAVEHNNEVRKAKSVTFSDNPTTFHPTFKTPDNEDVTADITKVNLEFYKSHRVIPGEYSEGQIPVKIVYDKSEVVKSNERRRLVQQKGKPMEDKELRTAGERKIVYQTIRRKKIHDDGVKKIVQENTAPAVWTTQENFNTKIAVPHVKVLPRRGSVIDSNQNQYQPVTSSFVSTSDKTIEPRNTVKEVNLSSRRSMESDRDGIYNTKNYNESVKKSAQAISGNTKTFMGRGTDLHYPSTQRSSRYRMNQMINNGTEVKDENKTIISKRDAVEKQRLYERSHSRRKQPIVPIVESESYVYALNGDFHYSYEGADGTKAFEKGQLKYDTHQNSDEKNQGEAVEGGFSYTDAEGKDYSVTYTADENGYRPMGAHLPTPPPIPPAIARALQYLATKPTPVNDEVTKSWW